MTIRQRCFNLAENERFQNAILLLIVINAVAIGLETFEWPDHIESGLLFLDSIILWIFVIEILIRLYAYGGKFFSDAWNNFDFIVVAVSIAPSTGPLSVLRVFRVFRALRLISRLPEMQKMVESMIRSFRGIASIAFLLCVVMYVFSVMATMLFGDGGPAGEEYFGNLGLSLYSLFQVMTLESWSHGIARLVVEEQGWWAAAFFITYIVCTSFTFLNMFIAVFTNTMAAIDIEGGDDEGFSGMMNEIKGEIHELKELIAEMNAKSESE